MLTKNAVDRTLTIIAAVAAPVLTSLVDGNVLDAAMATDIGAIVTAFIAAWHGGSIAQQRLASGSSVTVTVDPVDAASAAGKAVA